MNTPVITIIGCGNMGKSLLGGLINTGHAAEKIWVTDSSNDKLENINKIWNVHTTTDNTFAIENADIVIFAVKPQSLQKITLKLAPIIQQRKMLVISVAAGIRTSSLSHWLGNETAIIRCMPNTPSLIGCGATALFANLYVSAEQRELAQTILQSIGLVVWVDEEALMDTITALSGSGPAYIFYIMEMLQKAAEHLGLTADVARILTLQTVLGAARMALESKESLSTLCQQVTSPGGTTEKGLAVLKEANLQNILFSTLLAAKNRSEELAQQLAESS